MELSIATLAICALLILALGVLIGSAYYSWENHYRFKLRGSAEFEVGFRFGEGTPPQFEYFGLQDINDLLVKGARILSVREGAVIARQTGTEGENAVLQWTGFTVKFDVTVTAP